MPACTDLRLANLRLAAGDASLLGDILIGEF
jgi:hypothetical protein